MTSPPLFSRNLFLHHQRHFVVVVVVRVAERKKAGELCGEVAHLCVCVVSAKKLRTHTHGASFFDSVPTGTSYSEQHFR